MDLTPYFIPDNPITRTVVWVLVALFGIWIILLIYNWFKLIRHRSQIAKCIDVRLLHDALQQRSLNRDKSGQYAVAVKSSEEEAEAAFQAFCDSKNVKADSAISKHIQAIFKAGWNDSRLEITALVKNTASILLRTGGLIRSVLSLFIIIGLLGTLIGLAFTLGQLSKISPANAGSPVEQRPSNTEQRTESTTNRELASTERVSKSLDALLDQLKGAFAPSIWGVLFTILGVLLFTLYLHLAQSPLRYALERHTLVDWVPLLMPTPVQSLWEKLQISEQQIQLSLESARDVAQLAQSIQSDSGELSLAIREAKSSLPSLSQASNQLSQFSEKFVTAVSTLMPFQQQLHTLYEQLLNESRAFQDSVQKNIAGAESFQRDIKIQFDEQNRQLMAQLTAFSAYESAYVVNRQSIDANLSKLLEEAENTFHILGQRNQELAEALITGLGEPLRNDLVNGLNEVKGALDLRLGKVSQAMDRFHAPLDKAADKLEGTFQNLDTRTENLLKELQQEFFKRNEVNEQQLVNLKTLSEKLITLLEGLSGSSQSVIEHEKSLGASVNNLSQYFDTLRTSMDGLSQKFDIKNNGQGTAQEAEINKILKVHTQLVEEIQALITAFNKQRFYTSAVTKTRVDESDNPEKPKRIKRLLSKALFWRRN